MSMNVQGDKARLWVNVHGLRDGRKFNTYSIGLSKKREDGTYMNSSIRAIFAKRVDVPEDVKNGEFIAYEGFMSVEEWKDRTGKNVTSPLVIITKADFIDRATDEYNPVNDPSVEIPIDYMPDSFEYAEDEIPF